MDIIIKYYQGFFTFSLFEYLLLSLIFTHITIISVTLYLHRCMAHKSIDPNIHSHRFWLEKENKWVKLNVSKKGLKTIEKLGIEAVLKKLGK